MKIAFDAKRAFANARGLGNYSRDTIRLLATYAPQNEYVLCGQCSPRFHLDGAQLLSPRGIWRAMPWAWRSKGCVHDLLCHGVEVYHGLSGEIPFGIHRTGIRTIVTMHDAIFVRYPELYSTTYRWIFTKKVQYACRHADRIIAISEQTKRDVVAYFHADESKIRVVYQGCHRQFREAVPATAVEEAKRKYRLPERYLLYVGAIEPRKNLLNLVKALAECRAGVPLVIMGAYSSHTAEVSALAAECDVPIQFLHGIPFDKFPAIYRGAIALVYPPVFEGFGIPILEAMCVGVPVVTSTGSCFEETGGDAALYADPSSPAAIGQQIGRVLSDSVLREEMVQRGYLQAAKFADERVAQHLLAVYSELE